MIEYIKGMPEFPRLRAALQERLKEITPFFVTYSIMERYAAIRRALRPGGNLIGDVDTIIPATALERKLTLVGVDNDFNRVANLRLKLIPKSQLRRVAADTPTSPREGASPRRREVQHHPPFDTDARAPENGFVVVAA